jgi:PleD family two-component response regulator
MAAAKPSEIHPGLYRLSASLQGGMLAFNSWLIADGGRYLLVEAGPAAAARELIDAASTLADPADIECVILLDEGPFSVSALRAWQERGFHGRVIADWRVATAVAASGATVELERIRDDNLRLAGEGGSGLRFLRPAGARGSLAVLHEATGCLFSGGLGSSLGRDLPEICQDRELRAQRAYAAAFGYGLPPEAPLPAETFPTLLCPRFGSILPRDLVAPALDLASLPPPGPGAAKSPEAEELVAELDKLRDANWELRESMVAASDAALRDPVSGLYDVRYAEAFLRSVAERGVDFTATFARIDGLKALNRSLGAGGGDILLRDLAAFILERETEGYLFRWVGPVFLLILEGAHESILERVGGLRRAIEEEKRFIHPVTASFALVRGGEIPAQPAELQRLVRDRFKLLERQGGNALLDKGGIPGEKSAVALVLDADPVFRDHLVGFLNREGFAASGAASGGAALELMDRLRPEIVVADSWLPQYDAFQIRQRMEESVDLRGIPFILLSTGRSDELLTRAHSLGVFHVLEKPVSLVELLGLARHLVARGADES